MGCHFLLQGDLPDPGIKPASLMSPALAGGFFTTSTTWEAHIYVYILISYIHTYRCIYTCYFLSILFVKKSFQVTPRASQKTLNFSMQITLILPKEFCVFIMEALDSFRPASHFWAHDCTTGLPRCLIGKESTCQYRRCRRCWFDLCQ